MNVPGAVIGGLVAGAVGAGIWAGITYATGYEIGWIAWGVGGIVGLGVMQGARGAGGPTGGVIAVLICIVAILAGKYAAIELVIREEMSGSYKEIDTTVDRLWADEEFITSYVADNVAREYVDAGKDLDWPPGADRDEPTRESDYPADVWRDAETRWDAMSEGERDDLRDSIETDMRAGLAEFMSYVRREGFKQSFSLFDIIFFVLAIGTAYKLAAGSEPAAPDPAAPA